jgi:uracil-DNA glycosylase
MMAWDRQTAVRELLLFYQEAGVDIALGEQAVDRFADEPPPRPEAAVSRQTAAAVVDTPSPQDTRPAAARVRRVFDQPSVRPPEAPASAQGRLGSPAPLSADAALLAAREAARSAATLDELRAMLLRFDGCALKRTATQLVFADGNPKSRVMFVGEAPGSEEDVQGLPFVGRSGKLLDLMMAAIGLDRTKVYIANVVPWRPPGNRTPTPQETAICLPFTLRQIELADPDILVCLGNPSTQTLLSLKDGITKTRGRWFKFHTGRRDIRALPTLHPAYLLRQPMAKRLAWRDFLAIEKALGHMSGVGTQRSDSISDF